MLFRSVGLGLVVVVAAATRPAAQQSPAAPRAPRQAAASRTVRKAFKVTPWGDPDLQGTWSNQTLTPLERPAEFANKPVLTADEAREYEAKLVKDINADVRTPGTRRDVTIAYNNVWWDRGNRIVADRRTSLIVEPADGILIRGRSATPNSSPGVWIPASNSAGSSTSAMA